MAASYLIISNLYYEPAKYIIYSNLDNISIDWIPKNIDEEGTGSHNGENYIAYTFYLENNGERTINYWYYILIDDVIKNVDEAVRVMIFLNGEKQVYAKINSATKMAEKDTIPFLENKEKEVIIEQRKDFYFIFKYLQAIR